MTIKRQTRPVELTDPKSPYSPNYFIRGVLNGGNGWRDIKEKEVFHKTREWHKEHSRGVSEKVACGEHGDYRRVTMRCELIPVLGDVCAAMPFLDFFVSRDGKTITFFHKRSDFASGMLCYEPPRHGHKSRYINMASYRIFSPLNDNTRNGGNSTDDPQKAIQLCRKFFKYRPPSDIRPMMAYHVHFSEFTSSLRKLESAYKRLKVNLRGSNLGSTENGVALYNLLSCLRDKDSPELKQFLPQFAKDQDELVALGGRITDVLSNLRTTAHVELCKDANKVTRRVIPADADSFVFHHDSCLEPTQYGDLTPEQLVKVSQLIMEEPHQFVEDVGVRINNNEFIIFDKPANDEGCNGDC